VFLRLIPAVFCVGLLFPSSAQSGLRYHVRMNMRIGLSVNVWMEGARARLEVQTSGDPNLAAGTALLTSDGGENLVILNPARQEFFSLPHSVISGFQLREAQRRGITCDPITSEKMVEDSGPELDGYPTRHVRFHIRLVAHRRTAAGELTAQIEVFEHLWVAAKIPQHNTDLAMLSDSAGIGIPALDVFLRNQIREMPGFIFKRNLVITTDDSLRNHDVLRADYEVTGLALADSPASLFEVPAGFHVRAIPQAQSAAPSAPPSHP
jgi:hypothetical protein